MVTALRGVLIYFPANAMAMYLPILLTATDGLSTTRAGLVLVTDALVLILLGSRAGAFADRHPFGAVRSGFAALALAGAGLAIGQSVPIMVAALVALGLGVAVAVPAQSKIAMTATPGHETGSFMAVFNSAQFVSIGLATVVFAPLVQGHEARNLSRAGFSTLCLVCTALFVAGLVTTWRRVDTPNRQAEKPCAA